MNIETKLMKCANNEIAFRTESDNYCIEYELFHSEHSKVRSNQRGISNEHIAIALEYGTIFYKQGLTFYVIGKKDIPHQCIKQASKFEDTVVVISSRSKEIITCYKATNSISYIKHKSKKLRKNHKPKYA